MQIIKENFNNNLLQIVNKHAKYQKVMLIYDDSVANNKLLEIYELICKNCVFNKMHINSNPNEINNGYKLLIFLCSANSFLNFNFNAADFVNVFLPTDGAVLPFYFKGNNFLFLQTKRPDISIAFSVIFNKIFYFINGLTEQTWSDVKLNDIKFITQDSLIELLNDFEYDKIDLQILKQAHIPYYMLPELDYILLKAILTLIDAIASNKLSLVDFYKSIKDDCNLIDKFFALLNNNVLTEVIKLNYNFLHSLLLDAINKLNCFNLNCENLEIISQKIKVYLKNCNNFLVYLYIYNIFGY